MAFNMQAECLGYIYIYIADTTCGVGLHIGGVTTASDVATDARAATTSALSGVM